MTDLLASERVVYFASTSEAKKIVTKLEGEQPLAILVPSNIDGNGEEIHVLVEDPAGQMQTRRRFLFQLGSGHVTCMDGKPKQHIVADSANVLLTFPNEKHDTETM